MNEAQPKPLDDLLLTRRSMFYGLTLILAVFLVTGGKFEGAMFTMRNLPKLLYLAALPSACSFLLWGKAINRIGMLNTSLYVNLSPLITVISAAIFLKEQLTLISGIGMAAIVLGLAITQNVFGRLFRPSIRIN